MYRLDGVLTLMSLAMLCGCNSLRSIARFAQDHRFEYAERFGFKNCRMPTLGTLQRVLRRLAPAPFAQAVGAWGAMALETYGHTGWQGIAIDGKTVRGSATDELPAVHLLSALSQELKVILGQVEVERKTNEIKGIEPLLADLVLDGRVVTVDALLTQRDVAEAILKKGGTT
jgi:DDE family transposase